MANSLESNPRQRSEAGLVTQSLSNSLSDIDIHNYNKLFWMRNNSIKAPSLWKLGKYIGLTHVREEDNIIKRIKEMEERDNNIKKKTKEGYKVRT